MVAEEDRALAAEDVEVLTQADAKVEDPVAERAEARVQEQVAKDR